MVFVSQELVELISEATDVNRGQSKPKNEMQLSDPLNLEIPWHGKIEIPVNTATDAPPVGKSTLNIAGVGLDNFFSEWKEEVTLNESKELLLSKNANLAGRSIAFQGRDDLSLVANVQPSTTPMKSKEREIDGGQSSWAAEFQSAESGAAGQGFGSSDPFSGSQTDISMHVDIVFGSRNTNSGDTIPSHTNADDWFQDNPRSSPVLTGNFVDKTNSSYVNADDWF